MSVYRTPSGRSEEASSAMIDATSSRWRSPTRAHSTTDAAAATTATAAAAVRSGSRSMQQQRTTDAAQWEEPLRGRRASSSPPVRSPPAAATASPASGSRSPGQWRPSSLPRSVLHPLTSAVAHSEALLGAHQAARAAGARAEHVRWADEIEQYEQRDQHGHEQREHDRDFDERTDARRRRASHPPASSAVGRGGAAAVEEARRLAAMASPTLQMELLRREEEADAAAAAEAAVAADEPRMNGLDMYRAQRQLEQNSSPLSPPARSSPPGATESSAGITSPAVLRISRPVSVGVGVRRTASATSLSAHSASAAASPVPTPFSAHSRSTRLHSTLPLPSPNLHQQGQSPLSQSLSASPKRAPSDRELPLSFTMSSSSSPPPPSRPRRSAQVLALDRHAYSSPSARVGSTSASASPLAHSPARSPRRESPFEQHNPAAPPSPSHSRAYPASHSPALARSPSFSPARSRSASPVSFRDTLHMAPFHHGATALSAAALASERRSRSASASPSHSPRLAAQSHHQHWDAFRPVPSLPAFASASGETEPPPSALVASMASSFTSSALQLAEARDRIAELEALLSEHAAANKALLSEAASADFENAQLHECVRSRNAALVARDSAREAELARARAALAAEQDELADRPTRDEVARLAAMLDAERQRASEAVQRAEELARGYDEKLAHLLALSQAELAAQASAAEQQRQEEAAAAQAREQALQARWQRATEELALCAEERAQLRRTLWRLASAPAAAAPAGDGTQADLGPSRPRLSLAALSSKHPTTPRALLLRAALLFAQWRSASTARAEGASKEDSRREALLDRAVRRARARACRAALQAWSRAAMADRTVQASSRAAHARAGHLRALLQRQRLSGQVPAFIQWRLGAREARRRKQEVLGRTLARLEGLHLRRAMLLWRQGVQRGQTLSLRRALTAQKASHLRALLLRWRAPALVGCFVSWRGWARTRAEGRRAAVGRFSRQVVRSTLSSSMRAWRGRVAASQTAQLRARIGAEKLARAAALIARGRLAGQVSCFLSWRLFVRGARARKQKVLARVASRAESFQARSALRHWALCSAQIGQAAQVQQGRERINQEKSKRLRLVLAQWRRQTVVPAFQSWARVARESRSRKAELLGRCLARLAHAELSRGWRRWHHFLVQEREARFRLALLAAGGEISEQKRKRVEGIVAAWRSRTVVPVFLAWRTWAKETRARKRELLGRVVARLGNLQLYSAWRQWSSFALQSAVAALQSRFALQSAGMAAAVTLQKRARAAALIQRWRLAGQSPFFLAWRAEAKTARTRRRALLAKMLRRMERAPLARALLQWRRTAEAIKIEELRSQLTSHKRARAHAAIVAWRSRCVIPTFQSWRSWARERRQRKQQLLRNVLHRLAWGSLHRALRQWRLYSEGVATRAWAAQMEHAHAHLGAQLQSQKRKRYQAMLARWAPKSPEVVLRAWKDWARKNRERKRALLRRVVDRMANLRLFAAWRTWTAFVEGDKVAALTGALHSRLSAMRQRQVHALVQRWRSRTVVPVFASWRRWARETRARKKHLLESVLGRLANQRLYAAWRAWTSFAQQAAVAELEGRFRAQTAGLEAQVAAHKRARVAALIQQWRLSSATPVFLAWRSHARTTRQRKRELLGRVVARLGNLQLYSAWRQWSSFALQSAVAALQSRFALQSAGMAAAVTLQKRARAAALIQRWRLAGQSPFFLAWRAEAKTARTRRRALLAKMLRRMERAPLARALLQWRRTAEAIKIDELREKISGQKRARILHLVETWRRRTVAPALLAWKATARAQRLRKRELLEKICRRLVHRQAYLALRLWSLWLEGEKLRTVRGLLNAEKARRATALIERWRRSSCAPVFAAWAAHARQQKQDRASRTARQKALLDMSLRRLAQQHTHAAWRAWTALVDAQRLAEMRARLAAARSDRCDAAARMLQRWSTERCKDVFLRWRASAQGSARSRQDSLALRQATLARVVSRVESCSLRGGWKSWLAYASLHREHVALRETLAAQHAAQSLQDENHELREKLQEQIEIVAYLYRVVQNSV